MQRAPAPCSSPQAQRATKRFARRRVQRTNWAEALIKESPERTSRLFPTSTAAANCGAFRIIGSVRSPCSSSSGDGSCTDSEKWPAWATADAPHTEDQPSGNELLANRLAPCTPLQADFSRRIQPRQRRLRHPSVHRHPSYVRAGETRNPLLRHIVSSTTRQVA